MVPQHDQIIEQLIQLPHAFWKDQILFRNPQAHRVSPPEALNTEAASTSGFQSLLMIKIH